MDVNLWPSSLQYNGAEYDCDYACLDASGWHCCWHHWLLSSTAQWTVYASIRHIDGVIRPCHSHTSIRSSMMLSSFICLPSPSVTSIPSGQFSERFVFSRHAFHKNLFAEWRNLVSWSRQQLQRREHRWNNFYYRVESLTELPYVPQFVVIFS